MDQLLKQSTAATVKVGPFVDDTDGKTAETGLTIAQADIRLSKNGGAFAQTNNSAGATHDENGYYGVPLDATDTGTLGRLRVAISESGALPVVHDFLVVPAAVYDSLVAGSDKLPVDVQEVSSDSTAADNLEAACDGTGYNLGGGSVVAASVSGAVGSVTGNVGGNVSGSVGSISGVTFPTHFEDLAITDTDGHVTVGTVVDKTGYSLASSGMDSVVLPANIVTASSIAASALNGKGDWSTHDAAAVTTALGNGSTLTALATAAAVAAIEGDATEANQTAILAALTAIKGTGWTTETLKAIHEAIEGVGGAIGAGADTVTLTLTTALDSPIADADVWISTDEAGNNIVAGTRQTNSAGQVTFRLDAGVTYYRWAQKDGINFTNPTAFTAEADS